MNKAYSRIVWENFPSVATPLNESNLNKMDIAIDEIDNRVLNLDTTKADQSSLLGSLQNVTYDEQTGIFVFTWANGNTLTADLNIEKIPIDFSMSEEGVITMTNADGTTYTCDISELIKTYTFSNANGITWSITTDTSGNKVVSASINDGSIAESKLQVNFLANCREAQSQAEAAMISSEISSLQSEGYALGTQNGVDVEPDSIYYRNNAKYYADKAGGTSLAGLTDVAIINPEDKQALVYDALNDKWVNGESVDPALSQKVETLQLQLDGKSIRALKRSAYDAMESHDANTVYLFLPE